MRLRLFSKRSLLLLPLAVGSGCAPSHEDVCAPSSDIQITVGKVTYTVRDKDLKFVSPEAPPGLVNYQGKNSAGKYVRYCQARGHSSAKAGDIGVAIPRNKEAGIGHGYSSGIIVISSPTYLAPHAKPKWDAFSYKDIESFRYEPLENKRSTDPSMSIGIQLRGGETRNLKFRCSWTEHALNGYKGGWIGLCRPILPLADGNFLMVSTGGVPEDQHPDTIGQDIIYALNRAENFDRKEAKQ